MLTFENTSNKCWFISALQVLFHIPQIANLLRNQDFISKILFTKRKNCSDFALSVSELAKKYWNITDHEGVHDISPILEIFTKINRNFAGKKLYDGSECFIKMIETLDSAFIPKNYFDHLPNTCDKIAWKEYTEKNSSSFMSDIFLGQAEQKHSDGSTTISHFDGITVSIGKKSVDEGISEFLFDSYTKISRVVTKYPLILTVFLQKNSDKHFVSYDTILKFGDVSYELFATMIHSGQHWVTVAKGPSGWHLFDDSRLTKISDYNDIIQKDAMLCVYKLVSN